jgi:hypothetical protein
MSSAILDPEQVAEVRSLLEEHHKNIGDTYATKEQLTAALREFQQKNAKPPFALMAPDAAARKNTANLAANAEFKNWLGQPRSPHPSCSPTSIPSATSSPFLCVRRSHEPGA